MSVFSPFKAADPALTVSDLLDRGFDRMMAGSGNPYVDRLLRGCGKGYGRLYGIMRIEDHDPALAAEILTLPPAMQGDILARLTVGVQLSEPEPYLSEHDFPEDKAYLGERMFVQAQHLAQHGAPAMNSADAAVLLGFVFDSQWGAETFTWWPSAILDAVGRGGEATYAPAFTALIDALARKWDAVPGNDPSVYVVELRTRIADLRGEDHDDIFGGLFTDPKLMTAKYDIRAIVERSPLLQRLFERARLHMPTQRRMRRGDLLTKQEMKALSTAERGEIIASACKFEAILTTHYGEWVYNGSWISQAPISVLEFRATNLMFHVKWLLGYMPARFTPEQALWTLEGKVDLHRPGLFRSIARALSPDLPGAPEAVAAYVASLNPASLQYKDSRKSVDYLTEAVARAGMITETDGDALTRTVMATTHDLLHFVPREGTNNARWGEAAKAGLEPERFEEYSANALELTSREICSVPKEQEPNWIYRDALKHAHPLAGRLAAETLALAREGIAAPEALEALRAFGMAIGDFCDVFTYGNETKPRYPVAPMMSACEKRSAFYLAVSAPVRSAFVAMEEFCATAPTGSRPSAGWLKKARAALTEKQWAVILDHLPAFLASTDPGVPTKTTDFEEQADAPLAGLIWLLSERPAERVLPIIGAYALRCFTSEPGRGIKAEKIGNACLWTLQQFPDGAGATYLARVAARVKYPKVKKKIDAALNAAATAAGMSRIDLDELLVPDHGFADGERRFGRDHSSAVLSLTANGKVTLGWLNAGGDAVKAPTAAMKAQAPDEIKAAKALAKEAQADLAVQLKRIERLPLEDRAIPAADFAARYLDQPLIGPACRALIWQIGGRAALWQDGSLRDLDGEAVPLTDAVRFWHPVDHDPETVIAWRDRLEALGLVQPIKQAWREVYVVTDAERATGTYSNRFAGHILKQHQMMTLARVNGWHCTHRIQQDVGNDEPTWIAFPAHGVRAEYWTGVLDVDSPTLDSSAFVYIHADRTAFYRYENGKRGAKLAVDDVPKVIFSEVMRQCDLFVSISSISTDPNWIDRGAGAGHPSGWERDADTYWHTASDADLEGSAKIRREALERIVPRLKIADRLSLTDRHLHVKGVRRSYRIHIGSAAVHRDPDDRHVCIVPAGAALRKTERIELPFEGDRTLSLVLSKAMMLAADDKITDAVILEQI